MRGLREIVVPFALTRSFLFAVALMAAAMVPYGVACQPCDLSEVPLLNVLSRWDGGHHLSIARDGYSFDAAPGTQSTTAFSPLLAMSMKVLAAPFGGSDDALLAAAAVVSNVALLVGLGYLIQLGRLELDAAAARRAALYLLVFPTTVVLSAAYGESLFLALGAASLVEARRGRWWLAAGAGALAALARPFGAVMVVPLLVERAVQLRAGRRLGPDALAPAAPVLAYVAWLGYLFVGSGDPLLYFSSSQAFRRHLAPPWEAVAGLFDPTEYANPWIVLGLLIMMGTLVALSWRILHPSSAACATTILLVTMSSGTLTSFPRYALGIFPAFLVLGALGRHPAVHIGYLTIASVLATIFTAMFAAWYWIG